MSCLASMLWNILYSNINNLIFWHRILSFRQEKNCPYMFEIYHPLLTCILYSSINTLIFWHSMLSFRGEKTACTYMKYSKLYLLAYLNTYTLRIFFSVDNCYPFIVPVFGPTWSNIWHIRLTHKVAFVSEIPKIKSGQNFFLSYKE